MLCNSKKTLTELKTSNFRLNPKSLNEFNEIKIGLYSITEQEHVIFYRILKDYIRIVKVLHGSKDIPKQF